MAGRDVFILGINAYDHDVSACLLRNGEVVVAVAKERLTRVKHASGFHEEPVRYCLEAAGIGVDRLDLVVRNTYLLPVPELEQRLLSTFQPFHLSILERERIEGHPLFGPDDERLVTCSHHLAHAYSAFAASPFDEGAVMIVDGIGSHRADVLEKVPPQCEAPPTARESESYYAFRGDELECVEKVWMGPGRGIVNDDFQMLPGLGAVYSRVSSYVFGDWNKCGEVMGLAPYGRPGVPPLMELRNGTLEVHEWPPTLRHPYMGEGDRAWERSEHRAEWEDLARRVQEDTERVLLERARRLHERTGARSLCMAGGVALNCVANGRILEETPFDEVFIQPAAGDDGVAIGCALYGHLVRRGGERRFVMRSAYLGREYDDADVYAARRGLAARASARGRRSDDVARDAAALLARGEVIGWLQGGSEFGPRALGNRSILADPRSASMKDHVNARVKHRQGFRPFAPVVLAERAGEYFEGEAPSPFMLLVKRVRPEKRDEVPAIVHVDGTARVQTVTRDQNPRLHALLEAFAERTGVPMLLNTSFNIRGDPIVETPLDAMECFLGTHLDALVLRDWIFRKRLLHRMLFPVWKFLVRVRRNLRSEALMEHAARSVLDR